MRNALIAQWQAAGYLLVLAGLLTYAAAIAPFWSVAFALGAGAILLAPLGLSQLSLRLHRRDLAYFFALQSALIYLLLCLVGGMELLGGNLPTALDGVVLLGGIITAGAAGVSATSAALTLRVAVALPAHTISPHHYPQPLLPPYPV